MARPQVELLDEFGFAVVVVDPTGVISHCNDTAAELYAMDAHGVVGRGIESLRLGPDQEALVPSALSELLDGGRWQGEVAIYDGRGGLVRLDVRATLLRDESAEPVGYTLAFVDIGARVEAEQRAAQTESRLRVAHRVAKMGSWEWDPQRDLLHASTTVAAELGVGDGTVLRIGHALDAMPEEDRSRVSAELDRLVSGGRNTASIEYRIRRPDGEIRYMRSYCEAARVPGGDTTAVYGTTQDISARVKAAEELRLASGRARAELDASHSLVRSSRGEYMTAVADCMGEGLFTLDGDGRVTYMNRAAQALLGRTLGDVYGQVMHELAHHHTAHGHPNAIDSCPITMAGRERRLVRVEDDVFIRSDGSPMPVAYTAAPFDGEDGLSGCVVVFKDISESKAHKRRLQHELESLTWARRVQEAMIEKRFLLYAQPIVELATSRVVQRELLLRMRYPDDSGPLPALVMPGSFLPVAEEYGFIADIDRWVVDRSAELAASGLAVELNVSASSITDPTMIDHIAESILRTGADPDNLVFEITETTLIGDERAARTFVERLHRLGCKIALDDFGTGYGGFTYLKQLPIDYLKIDMEFVRDLRDSSASRNVVQAIVNLARGFELMTVAEGVQDQETLELLRVLGVHYAQGFHIGRPMALEMAV